MKGKRNKTHGKTTDGVRSKIHGKTIDGVTGKRAKCDGDEQRAETNGKTMDGNAKQLMSVHRNACTDAIPSAACNARYLPIQHHRR